MKQRHARIVVWRLTLAHGWRWEVTGKQGKECMRGPREYENPSEAAEAARRAIVVGLEALRFEVQREDQPMIPEARSKATEATEGGA